MWGGIGKSIPFACQDWANTKAAYRFLSNDRVSEKEILQGHFQSTKDRFIKTTGHILILHDTTEFSYQREKPEAISARKVSKELSYYTRCGILMHSSLAITTNGLPLGLTAIKFWTRKKFKGCDALKKHVNPTRVPINKKESTCWLENMKQSEALLNEPNRCVHVGDRESDIFELFCLAKEMKTHFLTRTCVDRLAGVNGCQKVTKNGDHELT